MYSLMLRTGSKDLVKTGEYPRSFADFMATSHDQVAPLDKSSKLCRPLAVATGWGFWFQVLGLVYNNQGLRG